MPDVLPENTIGLPTARSLDIEYSDDTLVTERDVVGTCGLDENRMPEIAELGHHRMDRRLEKRLATGDLDERTTNRGHLPDQLLHGPGRSLTKGVLGVAVVASQGTAPEPDEDTGQPGPGGFPLDTVEDLIY